MQPGCRIKQADLAGRAPLDAHLRGQVDEVYLRMERFALHRQAIDLLHLRQDARLQRVATRAEGIQRLAVAQEDGLLALVDDELAAGDKARHWVLPDEGFVVTLVADDRRNCRIAHLGLLDFLLHIGHSVAHGARHTCSRLIRL